MSIGNGQYQVSGFMRRNPQGSLVEQYQSYLDDSATCSQTPPADVSKIVTTYDAVGRPLTITLPDASVFDGIASKREYRYEPLRQIFFDAMDTETGGVAENTPRITYSDGNNRLYQLALVVSRQRSPYARNLLRRLRQY